MTWFAPFQTRVGRRITLLFVVSALLPILVLAAVGYTQVRSQLIAQARVDVDQAAKNVGMGIIDQLRGARGTLTQVAEAVREGSDRRLADSASALGRGAREVFESLVIVEARGRRLLWGAGEPPAARAPAADSGFTTLVTTADQPARTWLITPAGPAQVWGLVKDDYLFFGASDRAAGSSSLTAVCIRESDTGRPLRCPGEETPEPIVTTWEMFLGYDYHAPSWTIQLARPRSEVLAPVAAFRRTFLATLLLVLGLVLMLSSSQVRRSLQPLLQLRRGTERLARRDFSERVEVGSTDEFGELAGSFNDMAAEIQQQMVRLNELSWGALAALARTIDASSSWTAGHSDRVTSLALRMATRAGMSERELETLRRGGLLHDIGKIGIEPRIIDKAGALDPEELRRIREHPAMGAKILAPLAAFADAIPIVLSHHEKLDGTGYPQGLKGDAIPPMARLLAVADVYDALVSARPYREGWPEDLAIKTIVEGAGTHFDPEYVELFVGVLRDEGDAARFQSALQETAA